MQSHLFSWGKPGWKENRVCYSQRCTKFNFTDLLFVSGSIKSLSSCLYLNVKPKPTTVLKIVKCVYDFSSTYLKVQSWCWKRFNFVAICSLFLGISCFIWVKIAFLCSSKRSILEIYLRKRGVSLIKNGLDQKLIVIHDYFNCWL